MTIDELRQLIKLLAPLSLLPISAIKLPLAWFVKLKAEVVDLSKLDKPLGITFEIESLNVDGTLVTANVSPDKVVIEFKK